MRPWALSEDGALSAPAHCGESPGGHHGCWLPRNTLPCGQAAPLHTRPATQGAAGDGSTACQECHEKGTSPPCHAASAGVPVMPCFTNTTKALGFVFFLPCQESHMASRYNYSFFETRSESTGLNITSEEQITARRNIYCQRDWLHISCAKGRRWSCPDAAPPAWLLPMAQDGSHRWLRHAEQMMDLSLGSCLSISPMVCPCQQRHQHLPRTRQTTGESEPNQQPLRFLLRLSAPMAAEPRAAELRLAAKVQPRHC